jgi:hypothetical protein
MGKEQDFDILGEDILEKQGSFERVKFWVRGKHLGGKIISPDKSWSGDFETEFVKDRIKPIKTFIVKDE